MKYKTNFRRNVQYELMMGREATEAITRYPVGYLPIGCLERHGDHLPMGLDTIKAHKICCVVAQTIGGVVFPPQYYTGIHGMTPEQIRKYTGEWGNIYTDESSESHLIDIIRQLAIAGIKALVLYTGHYPHCQVEMVERIAGQFGQESGIKVIPFAEPMVLRGDHAGNSETSLMLCMDKDLVDMTAIREVNYQDHGWGEETDPAKATLAQGEEEMNRIIEYLKERLGDYMPLANKHESP